MINKLIIDGVNTELDERTQMPYTYTFSQAKTHNVRIALDDTDEICAEAFKDCKNLTKITIPEDIKLIKRRAFENCTGLSTFTMPASIRYIGANAFDGCSNLTEVNFESTEAPDVFCEWPDQCSCFVPNGSKYELLENNADADTTGATWYYTKTNYNAYHMVDNPNVIPSSEDKYYINRWQSMVNSDIVFEQKDKVPVDDIIITYNSIDIYNGQSLALAANTYVTLTYTLLPADETNHGVVWETGQNGLITILDTTQPNTIFTYVNNVNNVTGTGATTLTAYAESGAFNRCNIVISGGIYNGSTEEETSQDL